MTYKPELRLDVSDSVLTKPPTHFITLSELVRTFMAGRYAGCTHRHQSRSPFKSYPAHYLKLSESFGKEPSACGQFMALRSRPVRKLQSCRRSPRIDDNDKAVNHHELPR